MTANSSTPAAASDGERIAKFLARAGVASRRDAERLIEAGVVTVDGVTLTSPAFKVTPGMEVRVDGVRVSDKEPPRLWRYHKPAGLVTTHKDPQGRPTVFEAVAAKAPAGKAPRVVSVGRLDLTTEGLLLLTNDGALARQLELPSTGWIRRYRVRAHGAASQDALDALKAGVVIEGVAYKPIRANIDRRQGGNVWISLSITEGKNREVRKVMEFLGLKTTRLIRTAYGPFQLGALPKGALEEVPSKQLKEQLGAKVCKALGI